MTTAIDEYKLLKQAVQDSAKWAAMLGKQYHGGNRRFGYLQSLSLGTGKDIPTIYYQENDGAEWVHKMPASLSKYLESAIIERFEEIVAEALKNQEKDLDDCANRAVIAHQKLLEAAGIPLSTVATYAEGWQADRPTENDIITALALEGHMLINLHITYDEVGKVWRWKCDLVE